MDEMQRQNKFDQQLAEFVEQQRQINMSLGKAMLGLTDHIEKLTASQAATDERLNLLIGVVDGVIRRPPAA